EVREHLHGLAQVADPGRPLAQFGLAVVAPSPPATAVEADEGPVGRELERLERPARIVAVDECHAVAAQQVVDRLGEPAGMAELEAVAARRKALERGAEAVVVAVEVL